MIAVDLKILILINIIVGKTKINNHNFDLTDF